MATEMPLGLSELKEIPRSRMCSHAAGDARGNGL
jgi:hypothetical protein